MGRWWCCELPIEPAGLSSLPLSSRWQGEMIQAEYCDYFQVDPICLNSNVDILTRNAQCCIVVETKEFGMVPVVAIGATEVGTVE